MLRETARAFREAPTQSEPAALPPVDVPIEADPDYSMVGLPASRETVGPVELPAGIPRFVLEEGFDIYVDEGKQTLTVYDLGPERIRTTFQWDENTDRISLRYDNERNVITVSSWDKKDQDGVVRGSVFEVAYDKESRQPAELRAVEDFTIEKDGTVTRIEPGSIDPDLPAGVVAAYKEAQTQIDSLAPGERADIGWRRWYKTSLGHIMCTHLTLGNTYYRMDQDGFLLVDENNGVIRPRRKIDSFVEGLKRRPARAPTPGVD